MKIGSLAVGSDDSEKKHTLDDLVRKRRGGRGKARLSRETKVTMILTKLPNSSQMDSKTAYNPGVFMGEIVNFFPSPNWRDVPDLVEELCNTNLVTFRESVKRERAERFYYRTEEAINVLDQLEKIRKMKEKIPSRKFLS